MQRVWGGRFRAFVMGFSLSCFCIKQMGFGVANGMEVFGRGK